MTIEVSLPPRVEAETPIGERAIRVPEGEGVGPTVPAVADRSSAAFFWDEDGQPIAPSFPLGLSYAGKGVKWNGSGDGFVSFTIPTGGGGGGGAAITAVDTLAALTALDSADLTDGQLVFVRSYAGVGTWGSGWFIWDDSSTDPTDGGVTFVPDDLTAAATPEQVGYATTDTPIEHYALAHDQVVWGSVSMTYNNETQTIGSEWLHGHGTTSRNGTYSPPTFHHSLDHETGYIWGDYIGKLAAIVNSNANTGATYSSRHTTVSYRYCTGPGRWKRVLRGGYVTPQMFGAQPNDETFDCSHAICWAINYITDNQPTTNTLWYDEGTCWVYGFWGEVTSNLTQRGNGPGHCIVKYRGQQVVGAGTGGLAGGGVIDFVRAEYFARDSNGFPTKMDPYRLMECHRTGQVQFDQATDFGFKDGYVDGNIDNNMYFRNDTGQVAWTRSQVSQQLRESLNYSGFFITNESARQYIAGLRWYVSNFGWRYTGGSCHAGVGAGFLQGSNIRIGPSLSGRCLYGGQGQIDGLTVELYTRSSFASPTSGNWTNVRIIVNGPNPWVESPDWDRYPAGLGARLTSREAQTSVSLADERYGTHHLGIRNIEFAYLTEGTPLFQWEGEGLTVDGISVEGPKQTSVFTLINRSATPYGAGVPVATSGPKLGNGKVWSRGFNGVTLIDDGATGMIQDGLIYGLHIIETYAEPSSFTYSHDLTNAAWTQTGLAALTYTGELHDEHDRDVLCRLTEDTGNTIHAVDRSLTTTSGKTYVIDAEVANTSTRQCYIYVSGYGYAFFDPVAGTIGYIDSALTPLVIYDPETWLWRFGVKFQETSSTTRTVRFGMANGTAGISNASYTGDGSSYLIGGAIHARQHRYFKYAMMQANVIVGGTADPGKQPQSFYGPGRHVRGYVANITCDVDATSAQGLSCPQQQLTFDNVNVEPYVDYLVVANGAEQANCVPTVVNFRNCRFNNRHNKPFKTDAREGTQLASNLRIVLENTKIDTFNPSADVINGDDTAFRNSFAKAVMRNCFTADGRVSEFDQIVTLTVVSSSPGANQVTATSFNSSGYLFSTPLMWSPLTYGVDSLSAKAIACAPTCAVEITGGRYDTPGLRVTPTVNVTAGDVLTFRIFGAVAPQRAL